MGTTPTDGPPASKPNTRQPGRGGRGRQPFRGKRPQSKKFEGREALKTHVYIITLPKETANNFTTMTAEIVEQVGTHYKLWNYTKRSKEKMTDIGPRKPSEPRSGATDTDKEIWKQEIAAYVKDKKMLQTNNQNAYSLIYGKCSVEIRAFLLSTLNNDTMSVAGDPIALLRTSRP